MQAPTPKNLLYREDIAKHFRLSVIESLFLEYVRAMEHPTGWCTSTRKEQAEYFSLSAITIKRMVRKLTESTSLLVKNDRFELMTSKSWKSAILFDKKPEGDFIRPEGLKEGVKITPPYQNDTPVNKSADSSELEGCQNDTPPYQNDTPPYQNDTPSSKKGVGVTAKTAAKYKNELVSDVSFVEIGENVALSGEEVESAPVRVLEDSSSVTRILEQEKTKKKEVKRNKEKGILKYPQKERKKNQEKRNQKETVDSFNFSVVESAPQAEEKEKSCAKKEKEPSDLTTDVLKFFVKHTGKGNSSTIKSKSHRSHLNARIKEGATWEQLTGVIRLKAAQWGSNRSMKKYIRPATLFNSDKFWGYVDELNECSQIDVQALDPFRVRFIEFMSEQGLVVRWDESPEHPYWQDMADIVSDLETLASQRNSTTSLQMWNILLTFGWTNVKWEPLKTSDLSFINQNINRYVSEANKAIDRINGRTERDKIIDRQLEEAQIRDAFGGGKDRYPWE